jgi:hypothetical protein
MWRREVVKMSPAKVRRSHLVALTDLPNIGTAGAEDLRCIGIFKPGDLANQSPYEMYETLCAKTGVRHDPCVIDVFISITRFMAGESAQPWWAFTAERKRALAQSGEAKR